MAEQSHSAGPEAAGQTLAAFLRRCLPGESWAQVRKRIHGRLVRVNGVPCADDARRLREGDVVELGAVAASAPPSAAELKVLFQDEHVIVVEKPAGIESERRPEERAWSAERKKRHPTLSELLHARGHRPLPVHRLDRDTSGLTIYALSGPAREHLVKQFAAHTIERVYVGVAVGVVASQSVRNWIVRDRGDGLRGCVDKPRADAQEAISLFRLREAIGSAYSVVECELKTGRTHQIRVHLGHIGHPLCGEKLYRKREPGGTVVPDESGAPRQALHAAVLGFEHPVNGRAMRFEQDSPADLAQWLDGLRAKVQDARK